MKLSDRLRELRQSRKMTLLQVAEVTNLSVSFLSDLERGRTKPSFDTVERLASYYEITMADLLSNVDGWGSASTEGLAPGLDALIKRGEIDEDTAYELNRIQLRGRRPQTEEDWYDLYRSLRRIMRPYLPEDERS